jgi:urease accessory protein
VTGAGRTNSPVGQAGRIAAQETQQETQQEAQHETERIFAGNRAIGRIALAVETDGAATYRTRVHESGPLRVRFPGPRARELEAVIVNTGGGIAGGDHHDLAITVGPGAHALLTTAAAEKVYRSRGADAIVNLRVEVGAGAALTWLPQETILFDRGRLRRTIDLDMAEDARLVVSEAVVFGRSGMGEQVALGRFIDRWRLRRAGRLVFAETLRLDGAIAEKLGHAAVGRGATALATILVMPGDDAIVASVRARLPDCVGEAGISAWNSFAVARLCAQDGAALRHDLLTVLSVLRAAPLPRLWLN